MAYAAWNLKIGRGGSGCTNFPLPLAYRASGEGGACNEFGIEAD